MYYILQYYILYYKILNIIYICLNILSYYILLYFNILYYIVLYYIILFDIISYYFIYYNVLYSIIYYILYYIYMYVLLSIFVYYIIVCYIVSLYIIFCISYIVLYYVFIFISYLPPKTLFYEIGWYLFCCILNLKSILWGPKLQFLQFVAIQPFPNYIGFKIQDSEKLLWTQGGWIQDSKRSGWLLLWLAKFRRCPNVRPFSGAYELEDHRAP